jgi:hypothetical protein
MNQMDFDKDALKKRLLEMAKQESIKFGQDMTQEMTRNVKVEKNDLEKWVKIIYLGNGVKREPVNRTHFEQLLTQLTGEKGPIEYKITENEDNVQFQLQNGDLVTKVYDHYRNFFFGELPKELLNTFLNNYINQLMDEGCGTGSCEMDRSDSCSTCHHSEDQDENPE